MKALLDTHVFLWLHSEPGRVGESLELLADAGTELFVSAASAWEIAIKHALDRLDLPAAPAEYVPSRTAAIGAVALSIETADALAAGDLPTHHRDPFDRMLIAQAKRRDLTLVTTDEAMIKYDVRLLLVP